MANVKIAGVASSVNKLTLQPPAQTAGDVAKGDFSAAFKAALDDINATQKHADALANAYAMGDPKVGLEETMIASSKANISFQALVQVRNRLVSAYQDIMNMQV